MRRSRLYAIGLALAAGVQLPTVALADDASDARIHVARGIEAHRRGRLDEALEQFLLANRLAPTSSTLLNIGLLLESTRRPEEAFVYYQEAQAAADVDPRDVAVAKERLAQLVPRLARVRVDTEPPGAAIYVDRDTLGEYGRTPRVLALARGKHELMLRLPGHHEERVPVVAEVGKEAAVRAGLRRVLAEMAVQSAPMGADVFIDGAEQAAGKTPLTVTLSVGRHVVEARLAQGDPDVRDVDVIEGKRAEVLLRPTPAARPVGLLTVTSNVSGAVVRLDGRDAGFAPLGRPDVDVGTRRVDLRLPGHQGWSGDVPVKQGQPTYVTVTLEPENQRQGRGPWPWVIGGFGLVSVAAGTVFGLLAVQAKDDYEREPTPSGYDRVETRNQVADTLFVVGGAGVLTSAALFLLIPSEERRESRAEISAPR